MTIGIIGAGISGLSLAWELQKRGVDYQLWEAVGQPGGYIESVRTTAETGSRYLRELGPNSLLGDADLLLWLDELGLTPALTFSKPVSKDRFIFRDGQYRKLPSGPPSLLFGNFFSWKTKWAIFRERSNTTTSPPGETLGQFFRRRFSQEVVEYALGPFVAGIYAGDPEQLLVSETFPVLLQYEKEYGSVLRGLIKNQSKTARRQSFSFTDGMQMLPGAIASRLTNLSLSTPVRQISRVPDGWQVRTDTGLQTVDQLVITTDARAAAHLVEPAYPALASELRAIHYPPMTAVHTAYKRADVGHPLSGFGGLNPGVEGRFSAGHIWSSSIFGSEPRSARCPADEVLFTTFVGGTQNEGNARISDDALKTSVHRELADGFGIRADAPVFQALYRWERAIPQYDARIVAVKPGVEAARKDNLLVCANWYGGVSLSDCIQKAQKLARTLSANEAVNNF